MPDSPSDDGKRIDEQWKAEARREKEQLDKEFEKRERSTGQKKLPPASFLGFISGLATQTLMQLGEIENPFSGGKVVDLEAARYSIDLLGILEEKTKGNLSPDEERYLKAALYDLRMRYVSAVSGRSSEGGHQAD